MRIAQQQLQIPPWRTKAPRSSTYYQSRMGLQGSKALGDNILPKDSLALGVVAHYDQPRKGSPNQQAAAGRSGIVMASYGQMK